MEDFKKISYFILNIICCLFIVLFRVLSFSIELIYHCVIAFAVGLFLGRRV